MNSRTDDGGPIDDELRSGDVGQTDEPLKVDEIFEVDGDTTGADPDAADPAVNIRPHEPGHLA